jgi:hypothetical protein
MGEEVAEVDLVLRAGNTTASLAPFQTPARQLHLDSHLQRHDLLPLETLSRRPSVQRQCQR